MRTIKRIAIPGAALLVLLVTTAALAVVTGTVVAWLLALAAFSGIGVSAFLALKWWAGR